MFEPAVVVADRFNVPPSHIGLIVALAAKPVIASCITTLAVLAVGEPQTLLAVTVYTPSSVDF